MVNILWFLYCDLPNQKRSYPAYKEPDENWPAQWLERTERCDDSAKIKSNISIHEIRWVFWRCHHHEHLNSYWIFQIAAHLWLTAILDVDIYRRLFTIPPLRVSKLEMEGSHLQSLFNKTALFSRKFQPPYLQVVCPLLTYRPVIVTIMKYLHILTIVLLIKSALFS